MATIWFMIVAVMVAIYVFLDGFDLGAGAVHLFIARTDDMIISSGYNIAGPEVEAALLSHPDVKECAVIGAPAAVLLHPPAELAGGHEEHVEVPGLRRVEERAIAGAIARDRARRDEQGSAGRVQEQSRVQLRNQHARPRPFPRQRVLSAQLDRHGVAPNRSEHSESRRTRFAADPRATGDDEARAHHLRRRDRYR